MTSMESVLKQQLMFVNPPMSVRQNPPAQQQADEIKNLSFTKIDELDLRLQSLLLPDVNFSLDLGNSPLHGHFAPADKIGPLPYRMELTLNHFPMELQVDQVLLNALLSDIAPNLPFDTLPRKLGLALLQSALTPVIQQLTEGSGLQIRLLDINSPTQVNLQGSRLALQCFYQDVLCWAALTFTHDTAGLMEEFQPRSKEDTYRAHLCTDELPLETSIVVTGAALSRREISLLELHDIVLLEPGSAALASEAPIYVEIRTQGKRLFHATLRGTELQITDIGKVNTMEQPAETRIHDHIDHLDDIPMEVTFEIAKQVLTIEQLKTLGPGQIFALDRPLQSPVTVSVRGKAIAEAELVQIGDRIGARITRVLITAKPKDESRKKPNDESWEKPNEEHLP